MTVFVSEGILIFLRINILAVKLEFKFFMCIKHRGLLQTDINKKKPIGSEIIRVKKRLFCTVSEFVTGLTSGHVDVTVCGIFVKFKVNKLWGSS